MSPWQSSTTRHWSRERSAARPERRPPLRLQPGLFPCGGQVYRPASLTKAPGAEFSMTAHTRLDPPLVESIRKALTGNALPGEMQGLSREAEREAAEFIAEVASKRRRGELALKIESTGGEAGRR